MLTESLFKLSNWYRVERTDGHFRIYLFNIRIFSGSCLSEPFLLDIKKFKALKNRTKDIQTIIFGSSHGRDGFIADEVSFNLSGSSLDLYRIYHLYQYVATLNFSIKNIIVFYDVFHPGLQLEKTKEALRAIPYNFLYSIPYAFPLNAPAKKERVCLKRIIKEFKKKIKIDNSYQGNVEQPDYRNSGISTEDLVEKHLKNNRRQNNQNQYIEKLAQETLNHNQNLFIVTPPYREDYLKCLPPYEETFKELLETAKKYPSIQILNFQNDSDFKQTDFYDADHLNKIGAEKLTQKINQFLMHF